MIKTLLMPWLVLPGVVRRMLSCFELLLDGGWRSLAVVMLGLVVAWHIYVPIHELMHVAAALVTGGTVETLELKAQYGGLLLQHVFPFVEPDSEYAGRLTGFTVPNHAAYALVDFAPYIFSLFGLALVEHVRRSKRAWLFGAAMILTLVPLMSITGDYYEAASLLTTRVAEALNPDMPAGFMIADDWWRSLGELREAGWLDGGTIALSVVGLLLATWAALLTLAIQWLIVERWWPEAEIGGEKDAEPAS